MANQKFLLGAAALLGIFSMSAEAGYFKCVDKDGHVTYATTRDECPSQKATEIEKGREVKKKEPVKSDARPSRPAEDTPEQIEQKRHDQALLGTYSNEAEIDQALARNLQAVDARINSIQLQMKTAQEDLDRATKEKADLEKAGKPVDRAVLNEISQSQAKLTRLQNEQARAQADEEAIRKRFAADKQRYHELTTAQ